LQKDNAKVKDYKRILKALRLVESSVKEKSSERNYFMVSIDHTFDKDKEIVVF
jgi:uncharacterized protein YqgV (UPF0045/DUF77 family)